MQSDCMLEWEEFSRLGFSRLEFSRLGFSRFGMVRIANAGCESGCDLIVCLSGRVAWDEGNRVKFDITRVLIRDHNQGPGKLFFFIPGVGEKYFMSQNDPRMGGYERGF